MNEVGGYIMGMARCEFLEQHQESNQLYGRQAEVDKLEDALARARECEVVLISGAPGMGKTAVAQALRRQALLRDALFVQGRFEQTRRYEPYFALRAALRDLVSQIQARGETHLAIWREKVLDTLGPRISVLMDFLPELNIMVGSQPAPPTVSLDRVRQRLFWTLRDFLSTFATSDRPLIVYLDNLQWMDEASGAFLNQLLTSLPVPGLVFIGAYTSALDGQQAWLETGAWSDSPGVTELASALEKLQVAGLNVQHLPLAPLEASAVRAWLADIFACRPRQLKGLAKDLQAKTGGNPLQIRAFLEHLCWMGELQYDNEEEHWCLPESGVEAWGTSDDIATWIRARLASLPEATQQVLRLAARFGERFELMLVAAIAKMHPAEVARVLTTALEARLIMPLPEAAPIVPLNLERLDEDIEKAYPVTYQFANPYVYQVLGVDGLGDYASVLQRQLGRRLLRSGAPGDVLFGVVEHLNRAVDALKGRAELDELAELNLVVGQKAQTWGAYASASQYFESGLGALENGWREQYDLALALHLGAIEAAYLSHDFECAHRLVKVASKGATNALDRARVYEAQIRTYIAQHKFSEAVRVGRQALLAWSSVHEATPLLPDKPGRADVRVAMQSLDLALAGRTIEQLASLPDMTDAHTLVIMRVLAHLSAITCSTEPYLFPLVALHHARLSLEHGLEETSPYAFACAGRVLSGVVGDIERGYQFGALALKVLERLAGGEFEIQTRFLFNGFIRHWHEHWRALLESFSALYRDGVEGGDWAYAANALVFHDQIQFFLGVDLSRLEQDLTAHIQQIQPLRRNGAVNRERMLQQLVLNLMEPQQTPHRLVGEVYNEQRMLPLHLEVSDITAVFELYLDKLYLCYLFRSYPEAIENAEIVVLYLDRMAGQPHIPLFYFYDSLARLALYPDIDEAERVRFEDQVVANQAHLEKWSQHAPMNYAHRFHLVEAERARVLGHDGEAREAYDRAVALAQTREYLQDEALACELAGQFYMVKGLPKIARVYLEDAHILYGRWGAGTKVQDIETRYPQIFAPSMSGEVVPTIASAIGQKAATAFESVKKFVPVFGEMLQKTGKMVTDKALDFASVLKASQAISGELVLDKLLAKLMSAAIQNTGAQKGYLILRRKGQWLVEAESEVGQAEVAVLQAIPLETCREQLPVSIIHYVARTRENVLLDDASRSGQFKRDPYIISAQPKSVLCMPLLNQGQTRGIIYLENNRETGTFTTERLEVLQHLSGPVAVSLENARLYDELEKRVEQRTAELSEANARLRQEIVDRERTEDALRQAKEAAEAANRAKSAFLANMSHELRTPLNAILGFSELMARDPTTTLEQRDNLETIVRSGEHLLALINDVLELSKIESGRITLQEECFDLHRLLEGLAEMFRLRALDKSLYLELECDPQVPPYVRMDAGKLRQVLMNLLGNAVKFTHQGGIMVRVQPGARMLDAGGEVSAVSDACFLHFEVEDTGVGIAPEELEAVFDAFIQTQSGQQSQQGTGLGMPISRQFVRMMGGDLSVTSQPGKGSCFQFDVQAEVVEASQVPTTQVPRRVVGLEPGQSVYRLLVVEDQEASRRLLVKLLANFNVFDAHDGTLTSGFEVREAVNGQDALEVWREWQPHLIWMDMRMPVMDGHEATRQIKSTPQGRSTIIVALTASAFEEERAMILAGGCDDFVRKPFMEREIFEVLTRHLGVQFLYEDEDGGATGAAMSDDWEQVLTSEAFANLPPEWLNDFRIAVAQADAELVHKLLDSVREQNAPLANTIAGLVNEFRFDLIMNSIGAP